MGELAVVRLALVLGLLDLHHPGNQPEYKARLTSNGRTSSSYPQTYSLLVLLYLLVSVRIEIRFIIHHPSLSGLSTACESY